VSVGNTVRAFPTLLRIGFSAALAYRAEMFVWVLATTMPFISMALWTAVAREAPVVSPEGRAYSGQVFAAYFLVTFIVRQLNAAWAAWEMNFDVRTGSLAMRLLRPINPLASYAAENLAALPMRLVVAIPVAGFLIWQGGVPGPQGTGGWALVAVAMLGGWLVTFMANVAIGCLALFMESSIKIMDVWLALFFVFSGYLYPLELAPAWFRTLAEWLPFRYQIGQPVELVMGMHPPGEALGLIARQWAFAAGLCGLTAILWKRGLHRFGAYGG
jgi:ABC-2 type transport system permease protein